MAYADDSSKGFLWEELYGKDALCTTNLQTGLVDRPCVANESSSARSLLTTSLRQSNTLKRFSSIALSAVKTRDGSGSNLSPPSFKPPPRVTLTDQKKESWLKDLANPSVSLRRLSRTIPHGFHGIYLLESCLAKRVPPMRATWLVRCIGANEMRAFKKRNVSLTARESKWLTEWTKDIFEFICSYLDLSRDMPADTSTRPNLHYIVRLVTALYNEQLLDRKTFSLQVIEQLPKCTISELPLLFLILDIHREDFAASKMLLEKLLPNLLNCADIISKDTTQFGNSPDLSASVLSLLDYYQKKCKHLLVLPTSLGRHGSSYMRGYQALSNLAKGSCAEGEYPYITCSQTTDVEKANSILACEILDSLDLPNDHRDVFLRFSELGRSAKDTVSEICSWATSRFRDDVSSVFVAVQLLKNAQNMTDMQLDIFKFFSTSYKADEHILAPLLICEMISAKVLALPLFFQRLLASGELSKTSGAKERAVYLCCLAGKNLPSKIRIWLEACAPESPEIIELGKTQSNRVRSWISRCVPTLLGLRSRLDDSGIIVQRMGLKNLDCRVREDLRSWISTELNSRNLGNIAPIEFAILSQILGDLNGFETLLGLLDHLIQRSDTELLETILISLMQYKRIWVVKDALEPLLKSFLLRLEQAKSGPSKLLIMLKLNDFIKELGGMSSFYSGVLRHNIDQSSVSLFRPREADSRMSLISAEHQNTFDVQERYFSSHEFWDSGLPGRQQLNLLLRDDCFANHFKWGAKSDIASIRDQANLFSLCLRTMDEDATPELFEWQRQLVNKIIDQQVDGSTSIVLLSCCCVTLGNLCTRLSIVAQSQIPPSSLEFNESLLFFFQCFCETIAFEDFVNQIVWHEKELH